MKRIFTSSLVNSCNRALKAILLVVLACNISGAFAQTPTNLTGSENGTKKYTNAQVPSNRTYTIDANGFVVINGNLTINKNATLTVNGTLIVEGNLIMATDYNDWWDEPVNYSTISVGNTGIVAIKKQLKGTGGVLQVKVKNNDTYGTIAINNGIGNNGYFYLDKGNGHNRVNYSNAFYIDGATMDGTNESLSNTSSNAYTNATDVMVIAEKAGLLPIELTSFTATATDYGFEFNWVTASEDNNDYFTLEYSINGVDFNEIDYVHGAGTTSGTSEYEYRWDKAPEFDVVYFRLKQTDYNGEYSYSDIIVASRKKSSGANGTFRYGPLNLQIQDGELRYIVK